MNKNYLLILVVLAIFSCSKDGKESAGTDSTSTSASASVVVTEEEKSNYGVNVWQKVVLRETPEDKGKYITTINLAEKLELLDESQVDESGSKKREYIKVKLMDGKEGWLIKDFIVAKAKAGVMVNDIDIYARPDLVAKTDKVFRKMNVVGVSECQGDWCKVKGKRTEGTWMDEGWIKTSNLSYDEKDLAVAVYTQQALAQSSVDKKVEQLNKVISNKDFEGSMFLADVQNLIDELSPPAISDSDIEEAVDVAVDTAMEGDY